MSDESENELSIQTESETNDSNDSENSYQLDEVPRYYVTFRGDKNLDGTVNQILDQMTLTDVVLFTAREIVCYFFGTNFQFIKAELRIYDTNIIGDFIETSCGVLVSKCIVYPGFSSFVIQNDFLNFILEYIDNAAYYDEYERCYVLSEPSYEFIEKMFNRGYLHQAKNWQVEYHVITNFIRLSFFVKSRCLDNLIYDLIAKYGIDYHVGFLCFVLSETQICRTLNLSDFSNSLGMELYKRSIYKKLIDHNTNYIDPDNFNSFIKNNTKNHIASTYEPIKIESYEMDTFTAASIEFVRRVQEYCNKNVTVVKYQELKDFISGTRIRINPGFVIVNDSGKEMIEYPCLSYCYLPFDKWKQKIGNLINPRQLHINWSNTKLLQRVLDYPFEGFFICVDFKEKFKYLVDAGYMTRNGNCFNIFALVIQYYFAFEKNIAYELLFDEMIRNKIPDTRLLYFLTIEERRRLLLQLPKESLSLMQEDLLDTERKLLSPHINLKVQKIILTDSYEPTNTNYCISSIKWGMITEIEEVNVILNVLSSPNLTFNQMVILSNLNFINHQYIWYIFFRRSKKDHPPIKQLINRTTGYDQTPKENNQTFEDTTGSTTESRLVWIEYKNSFKYGIKYILLSLLDKFYYGDFDYSTFLDDTKFEALEVQTEQQIPFNLTPRQRADWILGFYKPLVDEFYEKCQPIPNEYEYCVQLMEGFLKFTQQSFSEGSFNDIRLTTYRDMIQEIKRKGFNLDPITYEKENALMHIAHFRFMNYKFEGFVVFMKQYYLGIWQTYEKQIFENISKKLGKSGYMYSVLDLVDTKFETIEQKFTYDQHQLHRFVLKIKSAIENYRKTQSSVGEKDMQFAYNYNWDSDSNVLYDSNDTLGEYSIDELEAFADKKIDLPIKPKSVKPVDENKTQKPEDKSKPYDKKKKIIEVKNDHGLIVNYYNGLAICQPIIDISNVIKKEELDDIFCDPTLITNLATADIQI